MNLFSDSIKENLINSGYKIAAKSLQERVIELERRIEQLERALELYRKGATRGTSEDNVG